MLAKVLTSTVGKEKENVSLVNQISWVNLNDVDDVWSDRYQRKPTSPYNLQGRPVVGITANSDHDQMKVGLTLLQSHAAMCYQIKDGQEA